MKRSELVKHLRHYGCELYREGEKHSVFITSAQRKAVLVDFLKEIERSVFQLINIPE